MNDGEGQHGLLAVSQAPASAVGLACGGRESRRATVVARRIPCPASYYNPPGAPAGCRVAEIGAAHQISADSRFRTAAGMPSRNRDGRLRTMPEARSKT